MATIEEASRLVSAAYAEANQKLVKANIPTPIIAGSVLGLGLRMLHKLGHDRAQIMAFVERTLSTFLVDVN